MRNWLLYIKVIVCHRHRCVDPMVEFEIMKFINNGCRHGLNYFCAHPMVPTLYEHTACQCLCVIQPAFYLYSGYEIGPEIPIINTTHTLNMIVRRARSSSFALQRPFDSTSTGAILPLDIDNNIINNHNDRAKSTLLHHPRDHLPKSIPTSHSVPVALASQKQADTCVICMDELVSPEDTRTLVCGHNAFHSHCVNRWLAQCPRCPLCSHVQSNGFDYGNNDNDNDNETYNEEMEEETQADPYSRALPIDITWSDEDEELFFVPHPYNLTWQIHHRRVRHVVERPSTPRYPIRRKRGLLNSFLAGRRK